MALEKILVTRKEDVEPRHREHGEKYEFLAHHIVPPGPDQGYRVAIYELPPKKANYPYHYHLRSEEVFYIISGTGTLRTPDGERTVTAGDMIVCPTGEAGAHQLSNPSDGVPLVYIDFDTMHNLDVCHYPDSGKVGVFGLTEGYIFRKDSEVDYFNGE